MEYWPQNIGQRKKLALSTLGVQYIMGIAHKDINKLKIKSTARATSKYLR